MDGGGAEKVLTNLVNALNPDEYDIDVVSVTGGIHEKNISDNINARKIIKIKNDRLRKFVSRIFYHLPLQLIYKIVVREKYDFEIAYLEGFPTRVIASDNSTAKKIAFVHCDVSVHHVLNNFYKNKDECIKEYAGFDKVCFVSDAAKYGFEKLYGAQNNSMVIHNVINFKQAKEKAEESVPQDFETEGLKLIAVGRLSEEKGYSRLVNVIADLEKKYKLELWILGDGSEKERIENIIEERKINSVRLLGFQENPYAYMKKADLFICPSFFEGYSTVVAEAQAIGLPVLTTDCAGMREILDNGKCGLIVDNSEEGIKSGLITLFENNQILLEIKRNSETKKNNLNDKTATKEYDQLFKELIR